MDCLKFKVNSQSLERLDTFKPATDSVEYLTVAFTFSDDWSGTAKTAKFRKDDLVYPANINSSGVCVVPWEVLVRDTVNRTLGKQYFYMTLEGVNGTRKITTAEVAIEIFQNGKGETTTPNTPTPDVYSQYVEDVKAQTGADVVLAQQSAETAIAYAEQAEESARSLKNDYSNALKGTASGSAVRVDDVSPVEHYPRVFAHGKNLFNGELIDGILSSELFGSYAMDNYKSIKIYLRKGTYTLSVNNVVYVARTILDGVYTISGIYLNDTVYTFTIERDGYVGFSMRLDPATKWDDATKIQIEKGETATEYTPYIDPSTVKVMRCGKNLIDLKGFEFDDSNYTHIRYVGDNSSDKLYDFLKKNTGKSIVISMTATGEQTGINIGSIRYYGSDNVLLCAIVPGVAHTIIELPDTYTCSYIYGGTNGAKVKNIQIELGTEATEYEEYKGEEYTSNADGTVEGIISLAPTMTLLTDTENTTVEVEYNRDINAVIADILTKLS